MSEQRYFTWQESINGAERLQFAKDRALKQIGAYVGRIVKPDEVTFEVHESFVRATLPVSDECAVRSKIKHAEPSITISNQDEREEYYRSVVAEDAAHGMFLATVEGRGPDRSYSLDWTFHDVPDSFVSLPVYSNAKKIFEHEFDRRAHVLLEEVNASFNSEYELVLGNDMSLFFGEDLPIERRIYRNYYTFSRGFKLVRKKGTGRTITAKAVLPPDLFNDDRGYNFNVRKAVMAGLNADLDRQYARLKDEFLWQRGHEHFCRFEEPQIETRQSLVSGREWGADGLPIPATYRDEVYVTLSREYFAEPRDNKEVSCQNSSSRLNTLLSKVRMMKDYVRGLLSMRKKNKHKMLATLQKSMASISSCGSRVIRFITMKKIRPSWNI